MYNNNGLNNEEVKENRKKYGSNNISGKNTNTFFNLFIETLGDPIIKILIIALAVKTIFLFKDFDYFETIGIVIAILVASLISAISEYGSNKAFERMQEESSKINVRVRRNKKIIEISIDEPLNQDGDGNELLLSDILGTEPDIASKNLEDEVDKKLLKGAIAKLNSREKNIMELRFGFITGNEKTQKTGNTRQSNEKT